VGICSSAGVLLVNKEQPDKAITPIIITAIAIFLNI
jgi:hypothetical protein